MARLKPCPYGLQYSQVRPYRRFGLIEQAGWVSWLVGKVHLPIAHLHCRESKPQEGIYGTETISTTQL